MASKYPAKRERRQARGRRPTQWTLARLYAECWAAPVVWVALQELGSERGRIVTPTRDQLADRTGIPRVATISAALTALESAGWIHREHIPVFTGQRQTATVLRIVLAKLLEGRRERQALRTAANSGNCRRERQALRTAHIAVESSRRSKGKEQQTLQDLPTEGRAVPADRSLPVGSAPAPSTQKEHPADIEERRLVAASRIRREVRDRIERASTQTLKCAATESGDSLVT